MFIDDLLAWDLDFKDKKRNGDRKHAIAEGFYPSCIGIVPHYDASSGNNILIDMVAHRRITKQSSKLSAE